MLYLCAAASLVHGQASPTASREADLQVGVSFVTANPDYFPSTFRGVGAYIDLDLRPHLGLEGEFHQVGSTAGDSSYERTYEIGARYHRTYGPLAPYVKALIGRGDLSYQYHLAYLGYTMYAGAAGADLMFGEHLRVRGDYEYQRWTSFPNGGLAPQLVTFGVAYHFTGTRRTR